jgi:hypothetical protein
MTVPHKRFRRARPTPAPALSKEEGNAVAPEPDSRGRIAGRRALGLGALAALFAFIGRSAARAADALTIDARGVAYFNGKRNNFKDEEDKGWLRVGAAWGVPGIYSEAGPVVVTSQSGIIWLPGNVVIKKADDANSLNAAGIPEKDAPLCNLDVSGTVKAKSLETSSGVSLAAVQNAVTAAQNAMNILIPVGTIMAYGGDTGDPSVVTALGSQGWLPCDGRTYTAQDYPKLAEVIGNAFGTLKVPDLRGRFLRGTDQGAQRDPDAASRRAENGGNGGDKVGSVQDDQFKSHQHQYKAPLYVGSGGNYSGSHWNTLDAQTELAGGNETRPKNVNVNWIIKAK